MKAKMLTQIKREFWECRSSFIKTPLVTTGILVVLLVLGVAPWHYKIAGFISQSSVSYTGNSNLGFEVLEEAAGHQSITTDPGYLVHGLTAVFSIFAVILLVVLLFYFADTLYSDRRDQSVLFWKSMPVSESETVLSKLIAGVIGAPAVYVGTALLTGALFTLSFLIYAGSVWKIPVPELGSVVPIFLKCALGFIFGWIVLALWYLPLFSWLLFSSAFVRKTPFMLALGLPLALIVAEKWVLHSHHLFRVLRDQIGSGLYNLGVLVQDPLTLPERIAAALSSPQFLLGLLVSAVLLCACVWLRKNRWEI